MYYFCLKMRADISVDTKQSHMTGVQFPVSEEALKKLVELNEKKLSLVQLVSDKKVLITALVIKYQLLSLIINPSLRRRGANS